MFSGVNAGTIRENRRHGMAMFYQKEKNLWSASLLGTTYITGWLGLWSAFVPIPSGHRRVQLQ
jgi:hypothetical protein